MLDNHKSALTSFWIETSDDEQDLQYIYWIQKMHKNPYKHRFIASFFKCSTKPLSILLTKLLTYIKQGLQRYCETAYSRSGFNQLRILNNTKESLEHLNSPTTNYVKTSSLFVFQLLIHPYLTRNWKTDSQVLCETPSFSKMVIIHANILIFGIRARWNIFCEGALRF